MRVVAPLTSTPVAIIGAGPYGLSIAAHLRARGITHRVFGRAMENWSAHMPAGMLLKSEGFASDLYDPQGRFTLRQFCAETGSPYQDVGLPIPLETIVSYGLSFQQRFVPGLEDRLVTALDCAPNGFRLQLDDGEVFTAGRVIVATGTSHFQYVPQELAHLPPEFLSHSSEHHDLGGFHGRDVTIVGGGASALDLAALLDQSGARVRMVVRQPSVRFLTPTGGPRSLWKRIRSPITPIGGGWRSRFFTDAPMLFRYLPQDVRLNTMRAIFKGNRHYLGPAAGWWVKDRIMQRVPLLLSRVPREARIRDGRVQLRISDGNGSHSDISTDHVIAATGYCVDLRRLDFLCGPVRSRVQCLEGAPMLSANFESSVAGLYFVGLAATNDFGPSMRFMCGAGYTARRLTQHLSRAAA